MNPIHRAAKAEVKRLAAALLESAAADTFREYLQAVEIVEQFKARPTSPAPSQQNADNLVRRAAGIAKGTSTAIGVGDTEGARIQRAARNFLSHHQKRASSTIIAKALLESGVEIGGKDKASRVSAYLSAAKDVFDNVRGEGYGLRVWSPGTTENQLKAMGHWPAAAKAVNPNGDR